MAAEGALSNDLPTGDRHAIEDLRMADRYPDNIRRIRESRGILEEEVWADIIRGVEEITGRLSEGQRFYIIAAVSGRRVEWAQARGDSHYHLMGIPCTVCGRS
jgi:hypothetical protein